MPSGDVLPGDARSCSVGVDENGLGARLGPLVVTAVYADVTPEGQRLLSRRPRGLLRSDLDDSKRLVSHANVELGEAWARVLTGQRHGTPQALFEELSIEGAASLRRECPEHHVQQCWGLAGEALGAGAAVCARLEAHLEKLRNRGVDIKGVRVTILCTQRLNEARRRGKNRFVSDLHAMEALLLDVRGGVDRDLLATCGKVGGMSDYDRFFGPLSGRLHTVLDRTRRLSSYYFPGLGRIDFVQDADAKNMLVMLASLVGKYVRELLMARVSRFYAAPTGDATLVSGYHDERTDAWVVSNARKRRSLRVVDDCFERARDSVS